MGNKETASNNKQDNVTPLQPGPNKAMRDSQASEVDLILKEAGEAGQEATEATTEEDEFILDQAGLTTVIRIAVKKVREDLINENVQGFSTLVTDGDDGVRAEMETAPQHTKLKAMKPIDREARRKLREDEIAGDETPPEAAWRWVKNKVMKNRGSRWLVPIGCFALTAGAVVLTGRKGLSVWNARRYGVSS